MKLNEFTGGSITLLIKNVEEKKTKTNKTYLVMSLTDGEKEIAANQWDADMSNAPEKGTLIDCELEVGSYNGQTSYTIRALSENTTANKAEYVPCAPIPAKQMYDEMVEVIKEFKNKELMRITGNILQHNRNTLMIWGAAKSIHHNMIAGLLYHMYRMIYYTNNPLYFC